MASALVDASAMVAAFAVGEPQAERYLDLFKLAALEHWTLSTTWPCVTEASYLVAAPQRYALLNWVGNGGLSVFPFEPQHLLDFIPVMQRYTHRPRAEMDLADASLLWLAEETGVTRVMTMAVRDFSRYRLADGRAFEIL